MKPFCPIFPRKMWRQCLMNYEKIKENKMKIFTTHNRRIRLFETLTLPLLLFLSFSCKTSSNKPQTEESKIPIPTKGQIEWQEQERLMFVCIDPCTWQGREYDNHTTELSDMKLSKLNTDQWCEAAVSWGAKQILFVAKHTGGFCWWQTETSDYSVKNIAWKDGKGDLLEELTKSCKKHGLNMGIYVYPGDDTWGAGIGSGGKTRDTEKQDAYNKVFRQQLREVSQKIKKQGVKIVEYWFDGSCIIDVGDIMEEEAPDAVILQGPYANIRWVGTEKGSMKYDLSWSTVQSADLATGVSTSYHSDKNGDAWAPCEVNTTLYDHYWFWAKEKEAKRKSLNELMRVFYESVGQGTVMLLNSSPNTDGLIPEADMELYKALGDEIKKRFDQPLATATGQSKDGTYQIDLGSIKTVNHIIVAEDYTKGERIRKYLVEGWDGSVWKKITSGEHVGRKHINFFDDFNVSKLRLKITESVAEPLVTTFSAYNVKGKKPTLSHYNPHSVDSAWLQANKKNLQSNWHIVDKWEKSSIKNEEVKLNIDLTGKITEAGQWQVKFQLEDEKAKVLFQDAVLYQQEQASVSGVLQQSKVSPMVWNINRTAVVTEGSENIKLHITLKNINCSGKVFFKRR